MLASWSLPPIATYAQSGEQSVEAASPLVIIAFIALFVGLCVVYIWLTWRNEKKTRPASAQKESGKPQLR
jgi:multidrug resistance efflux pump